MSRYTVQIFKRRAQGDDGLVSFDCLSNLLQSILDLSRSHISVGKMETCIPTDIQEFISPNDMGLKRINGSRFGESAIGHLLKGECHFAVL